MYAIVEIAGQQFKVEKDQEIFVHRLQGEAGSTVEFGKVMMVDNDGKVELGSPVLDTFTVKARIVEHLKGDKVIVFHKKRRKGYQKENGHRQYLSKLVIEDIVSGKPAKKEAAKAETKEEPEAEKPAAKKEVKAKAETTAKKAAEKSSKPKKEASPKPKAEKAADKEAKGEEKKES
ncbi:MAG: hypothetical protein Kow00127_14410 [Bacteroidales bacterium]